MAKRAAGFVLDGALLPRQGGSRGGEGDAGTGSSSSSAGEPEEAASVQTPRRSEVYFAEVNRFPQAGVGVRDCPKGVPHWVNGMAGGGGATAGLPVRATQHRGSGQKMAVVSLSSEGREGLQFNDVRMRRSDVSRMTQTIPEKLLHAAATLYPSQESYVEGALDQGWTLPLEQAPTPAEGSGTSVSPSFTTSLSAKMGLLRRLKASPARAQPPNGAASAASSSPTPPPPPPPPPPASPPSGGSAAAAAALPASAQFVCPAFRDVVRRIEWAAPQPLQEGDDALTTYTYVATCHREGRGVSSVMVYELRHSNVVSPVSTSQEEGPQESDAAGHDGWVATSRLCYLELNLDVSSVDINADLDIVVGCREGDVLVFSTTRGVFVLRLRPVAHLAARRLQARDEGRDMAALSRCPSSLTASSSASASSATLSPPSSPKGLPSSVDALPQAKLGVSSVCWQATADGNFDALVGASAGCVVRISRIAELCSISDAMRRAALAAAAASASDESADASSSPPPLSSTAAAPAVDYVAEGFASLVTAAAALTSPQPASKGKASAASPGFVPLSGASPVTCVRAFSSQAGKLIGVGYADGSAGLIDGASGAIVTVENRFGAVVCIDVSPCGSYLAVGGEDDCVALYSLSERPVRLAYLVGPDSWVSDVRIEPSRDEERLTVVSASFDGSLYFHSLETSDLHALAPAAEMPQAVHRAAAVTVPRPLHTAAELCPEVDPHAVIHRLHDGASVYAARLLAHPLMITACSLGHLRLWRPSLSRAGRRSRSVVSRNP